MEFAAAELTPGCVTVPEDPATQPPAPPPENSMLLPPTTIIGTASRQSSSATTTPMAIGADDPGVHWLPAPASSTSLTCQPVALETTVTAYCFVLFAVPDVVASRCAMLTTNVIDPVPNELDRVDPAAAGGDLLLRAPQRGDARRGVAVLQ